MTYARQRILVQVTVLVMMMATSLRYSSQLTYDAWSSVPTSFVEQASLLHTNGSYHRPVMAINATADARTIASRRIALAVETLPTVNESRGAWEPAHPLPASHHRRSVYSKCRTDRSGSVIQDMLLAHAYAYRNNLTYAGACDIDLGRSHKQRIAAHQQLIRDIRLQDVLKFACPPNKKRSHFLRTGQYRNLATVSDLWTAEWRDLIRSFMFVPQNHTAATGNDGVLTVAVHIRRGDITPCGKHSDRYLPNSHYLSILDTHLPKDQPVQVTVYSETNSFEPWSDFEGRPYQLALDTNLADVWSAIMSADYVVTSKSSFSITPASLNRHGTVLYTQFFMRPLRNWTVVGDRIVSQTRRRIASLRANSSCAIAIENQQ